MNEPMTTEAVEGVGVPVHLLMVYEEGEATRSEVLTLFSAIVRNGMAGTLQGHYGRTASDLIGHGLLTWDGSITQAGLEWVDEEYEEVADENS